MRAHPLDAEIARLAARLRDLKRRRGNPHFRWHGDDLAELKAAYCGSEPLHQVCADFGTSRGCVMRLARIHSWPYRMHGAERAARAVRFQGGTKAARPVPAGAGRAGVGL